MSNTSTDDAPISNRSEIFMLTDARNANPNGDPRRDDRPRRDDNDIGIVTDSRFKRYVRDQLTEDGFGVLLESPRFIPEGVSTREELYLRLMDMDPEKIADADSETIAKRFLERSTDTRLFGATVTIKGDANDDDAELTDEESDAVDAIRASLPRQYIGPIQFGHGESLHPVALNDESNQLAVTLSSSTENEQGTFADDHRVRFGVYSFTAVVNENAAKNTGLSERDVKRLDSVVWRAWKNQTLTRSKVGQEPRLYLRVEYSTDSFHLGDLDLGVELADEDAYPTFSDITDATLNVDGLVEQLAAHESHIEAVYLVESPYLTYEGGGSLTDRLQAELGDNRVRVVDPYEERELNN
ncbi:CRISPR-associated Csh2 family protein [Haloferax prahovense DSM 18310]|uniref:CRISPR-associated Csh2 family protein n=1 Tax=Haloferax prahovense (strain DSM 18310 / JCM 13924 / TL6) TaxID=1227461 RepID=M0GBE1_HALPT|nr:type I-B CRISPR-associated protein Cas7/Csh2 [Haloferax prahovense]ELZ68873.1 CRISPR-associated Csh2 family protein [Haloferax prahovense DSM 18310]